MLWDLWMPGRAFLGVHATLDCISRHHAHHPSSSMREALSLFCSEKVAIHVRGDPDTLDRSAERPYAAAHAEPAHP